MGRCAAGLAALALAAFPAALSAQTIPGSTSWYLYEGDNEQVRQYVLEFGKGPTVVVIHGGFGAEHSYLLDALLPLSGKRHFVMYDQRGSLRSPSGTHELSMPKFVEDLEALRLQLGEEKLVLLTHSMGAATAMAYLAKYPHRVAGLLLTAPVLPMPLSPGVEAPRDPELLTPEEQARTDARFSKFWEKTNERIAREKAKLPPLPVPATMQEARATPQYYRLRTEHWRVAFAGVNLVNLDRWRQMPGGKAFYKQDVADAVFQQDGTEVNKVFVTFRPALEAFTGPVEVVMGDQDYVDPEGFLWSKVLARVPKGKLTLLPKAGHGFWIDEPALSTQALGRALDRIARAAGR
jgi:pimeloyl-ACP methyl ester carboxylesterase